MQSPMASTIQVSVCAEPGVAVVPLHCPIKLTEINPSKTIFINRPSLPLSTGKSLIMVTTDYNIFRQCKHL